MTDERKQDWRILIHPEGGHDIQGTNLREKVREIAYKIVIGGQIRNLKDGRVEVICHTEEENAKEFCEKIKSIDDELIKIDRTKSGIAEKMFDDFGKEFIIIRENELTEMVWGLLAAGKIFQAQEQKKKKALIKALQYGLNSISNCAQALQTNIDAKRDFSLFTLENFLKEVPIDDKILMDAIMDLYELCKATNNLLSEQERDKIAIRNSLAEILKKAAAVDEKLPERFKN